MQVWAQHIWGKATICTAKPPRRGIHRQSLVREQEISENCNHIDVEDLPEGSYYLNVEENGRIVLKQTVIIKH